MQLKMSQVKVALKESLLPGAGRGVLATDFIPKDSYICFYDGEFRPVSNYDDFVFCYHLNTQTFIGYKEPRSNEGVGQFINDRFQFLLEDGENKFGSWQTKQKINEYIITSRQSQNVILDDDMKFYASRDIQKGEELYLCYGVQYWISWNLMNTDDVFKRLFCLYQNGHLRRVDEVFYVDSGFEEKDILEYLFTPRQRDLPDADYINEVVTKYKTKRGILSQSIEDESSCICGNPAHLVCSVCELTSYCSEDCQINDVSVHKTYCHQSRERILLS
jgi:hypothetical protein